MGRDTGLCTCGKPAGLFAGFCDEHAVEELSRTNEEAALSRAVVDASMTEFAHDKTGAAIDWSPEMRNACSALSAFRERGK